MAGIRLNGMDQGSTPRNKLERDTAGTGKEVEHMHSFEVEPRGQYVKEVLFGKVGGGAGGKFAARIKVPATEGSADNSHSERFNR